MGSLSLILALTFSILASASTDNPFDKLNGTWSCHNEDGQKAPEFMFSSSKRKVTYNNGRRTYTAIVEDNPTQLQGSIKESGSFSLKVEDDQSDDSSGAFVLEKLIFVLGSNNKNMTIGEFHQGFDPELECTKK